MNLVDAFLAVVILLGMWAGARRGLLVAGADLLALAASLVWALWAYPRGVALLEDQGVRLGVWAAPLALLVAYLLGRLVLGFVLARLIGAAPPAAHRHGLNRALGVVPGAGNGIINATVVSMLLLALPWDDAVTRNTSESVIAARLAGPAEWLEARLGPIFNPAFDRTLSKLTVKPDSRASMPLAFTVAEAKARPELEAQMLQLVNEERGAQRLAPLQADPEATEVARAHSRDMLARGYFSHVAPDGAGPFDRMRRAGLAFRVAGENLAFARSLATAHQGLMDSPGHRANILRPAFGRAGIGIVDGGRYGLMVTQAFRN